jgi:hypothetical protein
MNSWLGKRLFYFELVGYKVTIVFDSGWIEYFGGQGLYWVLFKLGKVN